MVFEHLLLEMESQGYEVQSFIIPACAVNAPHRRDRVWIIAHASSGRSQGINGLQTGQDTRHRISTQTDCHAPDTCDKGLEIRSGAKNRRRAVREKGQAPPASDWNESWLEVATLLCGVSHGVPGELHIIRGIENDEISDKKGNTEKSILIWKTLRKMWEGREIAKTSPELYLNGLYDSLSSMSCDRGSETWITQIEKDADLCNLWERFYALGFSSSQDLQRELLERIRKDEHRKKVASQRVDRLKSLGNAVVPQVVEVIGRAIMEAEDRRLNAR